MARTKIPVNYINNQITNNNNLNQLQSCHNSTTTTTTTTMTNNTSPKKIIIQKYNDDLEIMMIRNYSSRLFLTWIYKNAKPPLLTPIPTLNMIGGTGNGGNLFGGSTNSNRPFTTYSNREILSLATATSAAEIEKYVKEVVDVVANVIHFFHNQHCKRYENIKSNTVNNNQNNSQNQLNMFGSVFIGCIYYAESFVRKMDSQQSSEQLPLIDIMMVSITITIKMWIEEKMSVNKYISKIFGIPLKRLNQIETQFLSKIDYQLYLHEKDIKSFTDIIHKTTKSSSNTNNNNSNSINSNQVPNNNSNNIPTYSIVQKSPTTILITNNMYNSTNISTDKSCKEIIKTNSNNNNNCIKNINNSSLSPMSTVPSTSPTMIQTPTHQSSSCTLSSSSMSPLAIHHHSSGAGSSANIGGGYYKRKYSHHDVVVSSAGDITSGSSSPLSSASTTPNTSTPSSNTSTLILCSTPSRTFKHIKLTCSNNTPSNSQTSTPNSSSSISSSNDQLLMIEVPIQPHNKRIKEIVSC